MEARASEVTAGADVSSSIILAGLNAAAVILSVSLDPMVVVDAQNLQLVQSNFAFNLEFRCGDSDVCCGKPIDELLPWLHMSEIAKEASYNEIGSYRRRAGEHEYMIASRMGGIEQVPWITLSLRRLISAPAMSGGFARFIAPEQLDLATAVELTPQIPPLASKEPPVPQPVAERATEAEAETARPSVEALVATAKELPPRAAAPAPPTARVTNTSRAVVHSRSSETPTVKVDWEEALAETRGSGPRMEQMWDDEWLGSKTLTMRTHLSGILGMAQLLQSTTLSLEQDLYTQGIKNSANVLIDDLSDVVDRVELASTALSASEGTHLVDFSLRAVIEGASRSIAQRTLTCSCTLTATFACMCTLTLELTLARILTLARRYHVHRRAAQHRGGLVPRPDKDVGSAWSRPRLDTPRHPQPRYVRAWRL